MTANPDGHSPALLAALDQDAAGIRFHMLTLAETANRLAAKRGELQGSADLTSLFVHTFPGSAPGLAALAAAALMEVGKTDVWREIYNQGGE